MVFISHLHIYASNFVENLAENLKDVLNTRFPCSLYIRQILPDDIINLKKDEYFFIISPQSTLARSSLPYLKKYTYFIFQTEQLNTIERASKFHKNKMIHSLFSNSIAIMEYSQDNIKYYEKFYKKKPIYMPFVLPLKIESKKNIKNIDILFYGSINQRRYVIIEVLKRLLPNLNIIVCEKIFGTKLINMIKNSKIILNLHNYKDATLETARLYEAIPYDVHIISEKTKEVSLMESLPSIHFVDELIAYEETDEIHVEKSKFKSIVNIINECLQKNSPKHTIENNHKQLLEYFSS